MLETNDGEFGGMVNSAPGVEFGDYFYFSSCDNCDGGSDDGDLGVELWRTDGTAEGTSLFIEINPSFLFGDGAGGYPGSFLVVGILYFLRHKIHLPIPSFTEQMVQLEPSSYESS